MHGRSVGRCGPGLTPTSLTLGCARVTGEPDWWDLADASTPAWAPLLPTETNATRGTSLAAELGGAFEHEGFRADVTRAAASESACAILAAKAQRTTRPMRTGVATIQSGGVWMPIQP